MLLIAAEDAAHTAAVVSTTTVSECQWLQDVVITS